MDVGEFESGEDLAPDVGFAQRGDPPYIREYIPEEIAPDGLIIRREILLDLLFLLGHLFLLSRPPIPRPTHNLLNLSLRVPEEFVLLSAMELRLELGEEFLPGVIAEELVLLLVLEVVVVVGLGVALVGLHYYNFSFEMVGREMGFEIWIVLGTG